MKKQRLIPAFVLLAALLSLTFAAVGCGGKPEKFTVTANKPDHGVVLISDANPVKGANVAITAHADDEYTIDVFKVNGADVAYSAQGTGVFKYTIENISENAVVEVKFKADNVTVPPVALSGITAAWITSQTIEVFDNWSMSKLKAEIASLITVTGTNNDGSAYDGGAAITDYDLTGTLTPGSNSVTVSYQGKTTVLPVNVTLYGQTGVQLDGAFNQAGLVIYTDVTSSALKSALQSKLTVQKVYSDASVENLSPSGYTLTLDPAAGEVTLTQDDSSFSLTFMIELTLLAPANIAKNGNAVTWAASVGAANGYTVNIIRTLNGISVETGTVSGTSYTIADRAFALGEEYRLEVYANAVPSTHLRSAAGTVLFGGEIVYDLINPYDADIFTQIAGNGGKAWCDVGSATIAYNGTTKRIDVALSNTGSSDNGNTNGAPIAYVDFKTEIAAKTMITFVVDMTFPAGAMNASVTFRMKYKVGSTEYFAGNGGQEYKVYPAAGNWPGPQKIRGYLPDATSHVFIVLDTTGITTTQTRILHVNSVTLGSVMTIDFTQEGDRNFFADGGSTNSNGDWDGHSIVTYNAVQSRMEFTNQHNKDLIYVNYMQAIKSGMIITFEVDIAFSSAMTGPAYFSMEGPGGSGNPIGGYFDRTYSYKVQPRSGAWPGVQRVSAAVKGDVTAIYFMVDLGQTGAKNGAVIHIRSLTLNAPKSGFDISKFDNLNQPAGSGSAPYTDPGNGNRNAQLMPDGNGAMLHVLGGVTHVYVNYARSVAVGDVISLTLDADFPAGTMTGNIAVNLYGTSGGDVLYGGRSVTPAAGNNWPGRQTFSVTVTEARAKIYILINLSGISGSGIAGSSVFYIRDLNITTPQLPVDDKGYVIPAYSSAERVEIGGWVAPSSYNLSQSGFDQAAGAGFNMLYPGIEQCDFGSNPAKALAFLDKAQAAGMKVIVHDSKLIRSPYRNLNGVDGDDDDYVYNFNPTNYSEARIPLYINHPAFAGLHFVDEPVSPLVMRTGSAPWDKDIIDKVATKYVALKALFPAHTVFINLNSMGNAGAQVQNHGTSIATYDTGYAGALINAVAAKQAGLKLSSLSYDDYMLYDSDLRNNKGADAGGSQASGVKTIYFSELAYAAYRAKDNGIPAHNFLLSTGHHVGAARPGTSGANGWSYKNVTEADLRWQIAVNMAYGYKAFTHFTYSGGSTENVAGEGNYQRLINSDGTPTTQFGYVSNVNNEVRKWDNVYMSFNWKGTAPIAGTTAETGTPNTAFNSVNGGTNGIPAAYRTALSGITVSTNRNLLAGMFEDKNNPGQNGFMLTNATLPSDNRTATVTVSGFGGSYGAVLVYTNGVPEVKVLSGGSVTLTILPGQGQFVIPLIAK